MRLPVQICTETKLEHARTEVLEQHRNLRRLLSAANEIARAAEAGDVWCALRLPETIGEVVRRLRHHLAFEESTLLPCLVEPPPTGTANIDRLLREHARQRTEFATLVELAGQPGDSRGLALTLQTLIADVLVDMDEEERTILRGPQPIVLPD